MSPRMPGSTLPNSYHVPERGVMLLRPGELVYLQKCPRLGTLSVSLLACLIRWHGKKFIPRPDARTELGLESASRVQRVFGHLLPCQDRVHLMPLQTSWRRSVNAQVLQLVSAMCVPMTNDYKEKRGENGEGVESLAGDGQDIFRGLPRKSAFKTSAALISARGAVGVCMIMTQLLLAPRVQAHDATQVCAEWSNPFSLLPWEARAGR